MNMKLGTIKQEAELCRAAWAGSKIGDLALHCHHEILLQPLNSSADNRINYILSSKPVSEKAIRLRLFRPLRKSADWEKAYADWEKAYADFQKADAAFDGQVHRLDYRPGIAYWPKAYSELQKAYAARQKAYADLRMSIEHDAVCQPGCPWNGHTIFPSE